MPIPILISSSPKGTTVDTLCRYLRCLFDIYSNEGDPKNKKAQRRRMQGCIETVASLVCCTDVQLDWFGEVREVLSDLVHSDGTSGLSTIRSNAPFAVRWTCLSLVTIRKMVMVEGNKIRELAGFTVGGIAQFQPDYGSSETAAAHGADMIDECLETLRKYVELSNPGTRIGLKEKSGAS
jgi:hypothetical protein